MSEIKINRALISVSNKVSLQKIGETLANFGVELLSTGGSAITLRNHGLDVVEVSDFTGFPEIMGGRVKTLQPKIHGGLLGVRDSPTHQAEMQAHDIKPIDLLIVNFYPFEKTAAEGEDFDSCIEQIDIGGPALVRAAAKNHKFVTVIVDPVDYVIFIKELNDNNGHISGVTRKVLAAKAYASTCVYDAQISDWFGKEIGESFQNQKVFIGTACQKLRYGENPHQNAVFYASSENRAGVKTATQIQGKELSFNNINDTDAAFELACEFDTIPTCVIVKHSNPCGVASANDLLNAYKRALACDPESAFGGIVAFNQTIGSDVALELNKLFTEVIIAPSINASAKKILAAKKDLRILITGSMPNPNNNGTIISSVAGGYLCQSRDNHIVKTNIKVVTKVQPTKKQLKDMLFAFTVAKHVKSNAIVYAKNGATVGIGAGQMSRVNSSRIAAWKAADAAQNACDPESWAVGSVVASDAFFPFADGLLAAADAGAEAIIQPGGSIRDNEVIEVADEKGLTMVFTDTRHFRH